MATKKKTDRLLRNATIDALMDNGDSRLDALLERVDHKHQNGGIFEDVEHHKKTKACMRVLIEEEDEEA